MVKLNLSEGQEEAGPTIDLGEAIKVFASHSKSSPGSFHITAALEKPAIFKRFGGEVTIVCSCRGFQNHRKCWHKDEMQFQVSEPAPEDEECPTCGNPHGTHYEPEVCAMVQQDIEE